MPFIKREKAEWLAAHAAELWEYDESSPSCLRWKIDSGTRARKGSVAGHYDIKFNRYFIRYNSTGYLGHHITWTLCYGIIPANLEIDHIDRNSTNNKIDNLRLVTRSVNCANRGAYGKLNYKGICFDKNSGKYKASLCHKTKRQALGSFETPEEAARAWDREAAKQGRTDLNFPDLLA